MTLTVFFSHFIQLPAVDCVVPYAIEAAYYRCDRIEEDETQPNDEDRVFLSEGLSRRH